MLLVELLSEPELSALEVSELSVPLELSELSLLDEPLSETLSELSLPAVVLETTELDDEEPLSLPAPQ